MFAALAFGAVMSSCDDGGETPTPEPLVLTVDKESIFADGEDVATFTVTQGGVNVTKAALICGTGLNGSCLASNIFTTATPGDYEFYAYFAREADKANKLESNKVTITVSGDPKIFNPQKELHRNVGFFVITSSGCGPCGQQKELLYHPLEARYEDNFVTINLYSFNINGSSIVATNDTSRYEQELVAKNLIGTPTGQGVSLSYPTPLIELSDAWKRNDPFNGAQQWNQVVDNASNLVEDFLETPAKAGIQVDSAIDNDSIDFTVNVGVKEEGVYSIAAFVMEDHVSCVQAGINGGAYDHLNVYRAAATQSIFGDEIGTIEAGQVETLEYSVPLQSKWNTANLSLTIYVLYADGSNKVITNIVKAPANGFTNFKYAE